MVLQSPWPSPWASTWKLPGSWKLEATWLEPQHPQIFWGGILGVGTRSVPQGITFGNLEKIHTAEEVQNSTCKVVTGNVQRFIITNSHHHMITVTITSSPSTKPPQTDTFRLCIPMRLEDVVEVLRKTNVKGLNLMS